MIANVTKLQSDSFNDMVGRAPRPAADPLVGLLGRALPTLWLRLCFVVGQAVSPASPARGRFFHSFSVVTEPCASASGPHVGGQL